MRFIKEVLYVSETDGQIKCIAIGQTKLAKENHEKTDIGIFL